MNTTWYVAQDMIVALRAAREAKGLSLREVAAMAHTSPSCVLYWERGEKSPSLPKAIAWAEALGFIVSLKAGRMAKTR